MVSFKRKGWYLSQLNWWWSFRCKKSSFCWHFKTEYFNFQENCIELVSGPLTALWSEMWLVSNFVIFAFFLQSMYVWVCVCTYSLWGETNYFLNTKLIFVDSVWTIRHLVFTWYHVTPEYSATDFRKWMKDRAPSTQCTAVTWLFFAIFDY